LKKYVLLVPCLLILSAVALSACGGGGGSSDEGKIEEAIETAATTSDPSNCTELETEKFLEQNEQAEGAAAVKECEKEAEENEEVAESVDVSNVSVNGEKASAEAAFSGGTFDGQALEIDLVKEGDNWKLDEVAGFTNYDPQKLAEAFEEQFEGNEEIPAKVAACITEAFGSASQAEAEELIFSGSTEPIEELAVNCQ
jgi:hypothetical protein